MANWYSTGTISVTNGSDVVTGAGTNFQTYPVIEGEVLVLVVGGQTKLYEIAQVDSNTQFRIGVNYPDATDTGLTYFIIKSITGSSNYELMQQMNALLLTRDVTNIEMAEWATGDLIGAPASQVVSNGDFATGDTTGWTLQTSDPLTQYNVANGRLTIDRLLGSADPRISQTLTVVSGQTYVFNAYVHDVSSDDWQVRVDGVDIIAQEPVSNGKKRGYFTASGTTASLEIFSKGGTNSILILSDIVVGLSSEGAYPFSGVNGGTIWIDCPTKMFEGAFLYTHPATHDWSIINNTPTTLAGYGITDAADTAHVHAITDVTNLQIELDNKVDNSRVLTDVPGGALFTDTDTVYVHPNHGGDVTSVADGAMTLQPQAITGKPSLVSGLLGTDELLVSNGGVLNRMDVSVLVSYIEASLPNYTPYVHPNEGSDLGPSLTGATVISDVNVNARGHVTGFATRNLTLANLGFTGDVDATNYTHPDTHDWGMITGTPVDLSGYGVDAPSDGAQYARKDGAWEVVSAAGAPAWGAITGTLSTQTDLQTALDAKVDDTQVLTDVPVGALFTDTVYTHPTDGVDLGPALTGANVISDVTVNPEGHVTGFATRALTLANLGFTGDVDANNYAHPNHTGDVTSAGDGATTIASGAVTLAKMANMATASFIGRTSAGAGVPQVLSKTQALAILNVEDGATNYTHPNHTGDVTSTGDGDTVISTGAVTLPKMANMAPSSFLGRGDVGNGRPQILSKADALAILNVEDGATAGNYTHPNHTGHVTSTGDGATALTISAITDQPALNAGLVNANEFLVNDSGVLKRMGASVLKNYLEDSSTFAPAVHTHVIADVTGLQVELDAKLDATGVAAQATSLETARTISIDGDITATPVAFDGTANITITAEVNDNSHSHLWADITDQPTTLAGYNIDAPSDGNQYARKDGAWDVVESNSGLAFSDLPAGQPIVMLLTGQSNALGATTTPTEPFPVNNNVHDWVSGAWEAGVNLNAATRASYNGGTNIGMPRGGRGNIGWSAADRIQRATGRDVYVIAIARNSTAIQSWQTGGQVWSTLNSQVPTAIAAIPGYTPTHIDVLCWMQGEADAVSSPPLTPDVYASEWFDFWNQGISSGWIEQHHTQAILCETTETFNYLDRTGDGYGYVSGQDFFREVVNQGGEYFSSVSSFGVPYAGDAIHYTPGGLDLLGKRCADRALAGPLPKAKSPKSLLMNAGTADQEIFGTGEIITNGNVRSPALLTSNNLNGLSDAFGLVADAASMRNVFVTNNTATLDNVNIQFNSVLGIDSLVFNVDQNSMSHVFYTGGANSVVMRNGKVLVTSPATANGELVRYNEFNGHTHSEYISSSNPTITGNVTATGGFLTDNGLHGLTEGFGLVTTLAQVNGNADVTGALTAGTLGADNLTANNRILKVNNLGQIVMSNKVEADIGGISANPTVTGNVTATGGFLTDDGLHGLTEAFGLVTTAAQVNGDGDVTGALTAGTLGADNLTVNNRILKVNNLGQIVMSNKVEADIGSGGGIGSDPTITGTVTATAGFVTDDGLHGLTEAFGLVTTLVTSPIVRSTSSFLLLENDTTANGSESVHIRPRKGASYQSCLTGVAHSGGTFVRLKHNAVTRLETSSAGVTITGIANIWGDTQCTGNVTAYYSDERLKDISGELENCLGAVNDWRAVRYTAKDWTPFDSEKAEIGLLAQDIEKTHPEAVAPAPFNNEYKTLHYDRLVPVLVGAMQEMTDKMEAMARRIEELESGSS